MNKKSIILIAGQKRSGKDTTANLLAQALADNSINTKVLSFASAMKNIIAITLGITEVELDALKNDPANPHRGYLQRFGTEAMKPWFGDDIWSKLAKVQVDNSSAEIFIFADFRFPEEFKTLEAFYDVTTIKVSRPALINDDADGHPSERALDDWTFDHRIINDSSIDDLRAVVTKLVQHLS